MTHANDTSNYPVINIFYYLLDLSLSLFRLISYMTILIIKSIIW
jgi:hypothetical protein